MSERVPAICAAAAEGHERLRYDLHGVILPTSTLPPPWKRAGSARIDMTKAIREVEFLHGLPDVEFHRDAARAALGHGQVSGV
jgi:hypothetical protein